MSLTSVELTPRTGSEVKIDLASLLSGKYSQDLRELLVQRGVLVIRNVPMTDDQQRGLARSMGDLRLGSVKKEGEEGLQKVTQDKKENPEYAYFFFGSQHWHVDGTYEEIPPFASMLTPRVLSNTGGDTEFANSYAAYEDLPAEDKPFLDTLMVSHSMQSALFHAKPDCTPEEFALWCTYPVRQHPLVWRHKSGRKSLVLSNSGSHIVGLTSTESRDLLLRLMHHASQRKYVYRHQWQMGDLVIWDNTGVMHRVLPFDEESGRRMHRFTLNGEEPIPVAA